MEVFLSGHRRRLREDRRDGVLASGRVEVFFPDPSRMSEGHLVNRRDGGDEDDDAAERLVDADAAIQDRGVLYMKQVKSH